MQKLNCLITFSQVLLASLLASTAAITFHFTRAASSTYLSSMVHSYQEEILLHISSSISQLLNKAEQCGTGFAQNLDLIYSPGLNLSFDQKKDLTAFSLRKTFQNCDTVSGLGLTMEEGPYMIVNSIDNAMSPYANTSLLWTFANQTLPKGQAPLRFVTVSQFTANDRYAVVACVCLQKVEKPDLDGEPV